ncbi:hypothetical protein [Plasmodium yoelii yoelii]|uniref:Uncharacterized protein n=1 Tax=Plasmodium yoelii yoelii TaxID=73239 RepID=Q7RRR7_PLAYO|nr:hypothetical protein [Plasmodium yoelii yoelii]
MATVEKQVWYEMTNYRRNNILKLRKYMNENLYEQLPPMKTLHTFIEEVLGSISEVYLSVYEFDHQIKSIEKKKKNYDCT